jgi:hypothetical protein
MEKQILDRFYAFIKAMKDCELTAWGNSNNAGRIADDDERAVAHKHQMKDHSSSLCAIKEEYCPTSNMRVADRHIQYPPEYDLDTLNNISIERISDKEVKVIAHVNSGFYRGLINAYHFTFIDGKWIIKSRKTKRSESEKWQSRKI